MENRDRNGALRGSGCGDPTGTRASLGDRIDPPSLKIDIILSLVLVSAEIKVHFHSLPFLELIERSSAVLENL